LYRKLVPKNIAPKNKSNDGFASLIIGMNMFLNNTAKISVILIAAVLVIQSVFAAGDMTKNDACYKGLELYVNGEFKKAMGVFEKVAKKKDACSQFQIGMMYFYGHGVKKSSKNADTWLKKSLGNGFKKAAAQLDLMKKQKS